MTRPNFPRTFLCLAFLALSLATAPFANSAHTATGYFQRYCDGVWIYFTNADGVPPYGQFKIFFRMPTPGFSGSFLFEEEWWDHVYPSRCSLDGECEGATSAKMWIDKGTSATKHMCGKYDFEFSGRHYQGQFAVKEHKPNGIRLCE